MIRLLAMMLACWIAVSTGSPASASPPRDFISAMTITLAVDPAQAKLEAEREIARLSASGTGGNDAALAAAHWVRAQASFRLGDAAAARSELALARRLAPADASGTQVRAYASLLSGLMARGEGDFARALTALRVAQQGFIAAGDHRGQALALQSVGVLYNDVGNGEEAIRYFTLAEDAYAGDDVFFLSLNNNFGVAYQSAGQLASSEQRLRRAADYARRLGIDSFRRQITLNIAATQTFTDRLVEAERTLAAFEADDTPVTADQLREVQRLRALIALKRNDLPTALRQVRLALAGSNPATSDASYWKVHNAAYQIFRAAGLRDASLVQLEAVRRLDAADAEMIASNRAALLSAQFQLSAQGTRIAQLKADSLEREVGFQRTMTVTIIVGSLLALALLIGLLFTALRARNRAQADGAALAVVNHRLESALAAKTEFLASTSHELRTPLNGILGMTQILLADSAIAPRHRTQIELLHDAGSTMRALVDDILDVAKIEHGGFTIAPKPTDVGALAERVIRMFEAQAQTAGLALDFTIAGDSPHAMVDPDRLTQILFNLVGNALKFTHDGAVTVTLSTATMPLAGDGAPSPALEIAVRDSGIGIASEWHEAVFDMFRQVDGARTRNYGGTGLGLAICRQLARAMGGDIVLASAPGEGSTFTVTLPWNAVPEVHPASGPVRPDKSGCGDIGCGQVVVVGTDPMRIAMLSAIVRRTGADMTIADTFEQIETVMASKSLTLLVDAAAWPLIGAIADDVADSKHSIIIVGDSDGEIPVLMANGSRPMVAAFSRNAIADALAAVVRSAESSAEFTLPDDARVAIAQQQKRLEPKRSASMSRK